MTEPGASGAESAGVLARIGRALADAGVTGILIGGHAVNRWLEPRFTADVDVTINADAGTLGGLKEGLKVLGYRLATEQGGTAPSGPDFLRFVSDQGLPVLELQAAKTEFQRAAIERGTKGSASTLPIATVEDLIVMKLIAFRPKDRIDLEGLSVLPGIDWSHVERWAREWEVLDRLGATRRSQG